MPQARPTNRLTVHSLPVKRHGDGGVNGFGDGRQSDVRKPMLPSVIPVEFPWGSSRLYPAMYAQDHQLWSRALTTGSNAECGEVAVVERQRCDRLVRA